METTNLKFAFTSSLLASLAIRLSLHDRPNRRLELFGHKTALHLDAVDLSLSILPRPVHLLKVRLAHLSAPEEGLFMGGFLPHLLEISPCLLKGESPSFFDLLHLMFCLLETAQMLLHLLDNLIDLEISEIHLPKTFQDLLLLLSDLGLNLGFRKFSVSAEPPDPFITPSNPFDPFQELLPSGPSLPPDSSPPHRSRWSLHESPLSLP